MWLYRLHVGQNIADYKHCNKLHMDCWLTTYETMCTEYVTQRKEPGRFSMQVYLILLLLDGM